MRSWFTVILFLVACWSRANATSLPDPETRGVWAPTGYSPTDSAGINAMIRNLSRANFNVIYLDVWDNKYGTTIYPSTVVQGAGGPRQSPRFTGDPLQTYIDIAHKYGMEVIAWFETMPLDISLSSDSTDVPGILRAHPDWSMVQRDTTKRFHRSQWGYFFGIDPGVSGAANFVVSVITECVRNHPGLDGIETDIENDTTFSYSDTARIRFMQETEGPDPLTLAGNDTAWLAWRRLQVTNIIRKIYQNVKAVNPQCVVSAAVVPPIYGMAVQLESWDQWAVDGYVDMLEPMLYLDLPTFDPQLKWCRAHVPPGFQLSTGIPADLPLVKMISEIKDARSNGAAGEVIWYYSPISSLDKLAGFKSGAYTVRTLPSFDDLVADNASPGSFSRQGLWTLMRGGYLPLGQQSPTYFESTASSANTATFTFRILRSGDYSLYGFWSGDKSSNCKSVLVNVVSSSVSKVDTVNQSEGLNTWNLIDRFTLSSGDTVRITIRGSGTGNVIADAFRLRREI